LKNNDEKHAGREKINSRLVSAIYIFIEKKGWAGACIKNWTEMTDAGAEAGGNIKSATKLLMRRYSDTRGKAI